LVGWSGREEKVENKVWSISYYITLLEFRHRKKYRPPSFASLPSKYVSFLSLAVPSTARSCFFSPKKYNMGFSESVPCLFRMKGENIRKEEV